MGVHGLFLMDPQDATEKNRFVVQLYALFRASLLCQKTLENFR